MSPDDTIYLTRSDILTVDDNPYILVKLADSESMSNPSFYMTNHVIENTFVLINLDTQEVETSDVESHKGNTCKHCNSQKATKTVSGFEIHNKRVNVISDDEEIPTEAKRDEFQLCTECIRKINAEYQVALDGEEEDLLSHII